MRRCFQSSSWLVWPSTMAFVIVVIRCMYWWAHWAGILVAVGGLMVTCSHGICFQKALLVTSPFVPTCSRCCTSSVGSLCLLCGAGMVFRSGEGISVVLLASCVSARWRSLDWLEIALQVGREQFPSAEHRLRILEQEAQGVVGWISVSMSSQFSDSPRSVLNMLVAPRVQGPSLSFFAPRRAVPCEGVYGAFWCSDLLIPWPFVFPGEHRKLWFSSIVCLVDVHDLTVLVSSLLWVFRFSDPLCPQVIPGLGPIT